MSSHDPRKPEESLAAAASDLEVVPEGATPEKPEPYMVHAEFEGMRDGSGRTRYEYPTDCEGTLQIVDRSGVVWELECDRCGFEVGCNLLKSDPARLVEYRLGRSGIPESFLGRRFDKSEPAQQPTLGTCRQWLREFRSSPLPAIALFGSPGRGKTHLLCLIVETLIRTHGVDAVYRSAAGMFDELRAAMDRGGSDVVWQRLINVDVLALDDVGAGRRSDWELDRLAALVDHRYAKELPLLVATNLPPARWEDEFGERTASRLKGMCVRLRLEGPDRRAQGVQESFEAAA